MSTRRIDRAALETALSIRDLSDERQGAHAMQQLLHALHQELAQQWGCARLVHRGSPVVSVDDNYDALGYPPESVTRDARYTRYVTERMILRTQASAAVPGVLRSLAHSPPADLLVVSPGLVYRRDVIDRLHTGEPHQVDLWRVRTAAAALTERDLDEMIATVARAALPGMTYRTTPAVHPYTCAGRQIDVEVGGDWVEIGECGLADPALLHRSGLDPGVTSGLAMGLGLDRLLMLRKGIADIRLLRSDDPRVAGQMLDLAPYRSVSRQPAVPRDLSIAVPRDWLAEDLGDLIRSRLPHRTDWIESAEVLSETLWEALPQSARDRMGMQPSQKNVLLRLVIRHPTRTLTSAEANMLRDEVYQTIHTGSRLELACDP